MTISRASTFPVGQGSGTGQTTLSVNTQAVGDLVILSVLVGSNTLRVTGVSGGHATGWKPVIAHTDFVQTLRQEVWIGTATATGSQNITVTYSASASGIFTELNADSLHSDGTPSWNVVGATGKHVLTGTTNSLPTLTATASGQCYWGFSSPVQTAVAGTTSGFTYNLLDSSFVVMAINTNISSGAITPNVKQTPTGAATLCGMIISETAIASSGLRYVGPQTFGYGHNSTTVRVLKPYGVEAGDLLLIAGLGFLSTDTTGTPTGFTLVKDGAHLGTLYGRIADGSEADDFVFTFGSNGEEMASCIAIRGSNASSATAEWMDPSTFPSWYDPNTSGTTIPVPAVTLVKSTDWLIGFFGAVAATSQVVGLPSGFATRAGSAGSGTTNGSDIFAAYGDVQSIAAGSTGTKTGSCVSAIRFGLIVGIIAAAPGSVSMHKMGLSGSGTEEFIGTGSLSMHKMGLSGSGSVNTGIVGTGSVSMHKMGVSGSGTEKFIGTGSVHMHKMGLSGSGTEKFIGTGSVHMHKMGLSGSGTEKFIGTGSVSTHKTGLSGSGTEKISGTGSVSMHKMGLSGSGTNSSYVSGTGSVSMHKMGLSGSGTEKISGTGSISMHKMGLSGSGTEKISGTGSLSMHKMGLSGTGLSGADIGTGSVRVKKPSLSGIGGTILNNTAEGGSNGTTLSAANSGGASRAPFDVVSIGSLATLTYDDTHPMHGAYAYKVTTGSPAANCIFEWTNALTQGTYTQVWFRVYLYVTATPGTQTRFLRALSGGTLRAYLVINTARKLAVVDAGGTSRGTATTALPTDQWVRVEGYFKGDASNGQIELKYWTNADSIDTPTETITSASNLNTGGTINRVDMGNPSSTVSYTLWLDDPGVSPYGYMGPLNGSTGSIGIHKMGLSGSGTEKISGTGSVHMHKMGLSGSGKETETGTGSVQIHKMGLSGSGTEEFIGTGSVQMHKMGLSGAGKETETGTGSVHMHKMGLSGSGTEKFTSTGSVSLHKMGVSGSAIEKVAGSGDVALHKMGLSGAYESPGSGNVALHKMGLSGDAYEQESGTGSISMRKMSVQLHGGAGRRASSMFVFAPV